MHGQQILKKKKKKIEVTAIAEIQIISFYFVSKVLEAPSPVTTGQDLNENIVQSVCVLMLGFFARIFFCSF